jgi:histidyl-tRNA synthetase
MQIGTNILVIVSPKDYYSNGLMFRCTVNFQDQNTRSSRKPAEILAYGGRYDGLIQRYMHSSSANKNLHAVGVIVSIQKITLRMITYTSTLINSKQGRKKDSLNFERDFIPKKW